MYIFPLLDAIRFDLKIVEDGKLFMVSYDNISPVKLIRCGAKGTSMPLQAQRLGLNLISFCRAEGEKGMNCTSHERMPRL